MRHYTTLIDRVISLIFSVSHMIHFYQSPFLIMKQQSEEHWKVPNNTIIFRSNKILITAIWFLVQEQSSVWQEREIYELLNWSLSGKATHLVHENVATSTKFTWQYKVLHFVFSENISENNNKLAAMYCSNKPCFIYYIVKKIQNVNLMLLKNWNSNSYLRKFCTTGRNKK